MNRTIHCGAAAAAVLLTASALAACGGSSSSGGSAGAAHAKKLSFQLTDSGCTPNSATVDAGPVTIVATNPGTSKTDELELKNGDGIILGERENLAPGLSGDFTLTLQPGRYVVDCTFQNEDRRGGTLTVTGSAVASKGASAAKLAAGVAAYKAYVQRQSGELLTQTQAFVAALEAGDVQRAKALFGPARSHYEAIEPIAESFGDLDPEIDARANDVPAKDFKGFHRIEQQLWVDGNTAGMTPFDDELLANVKKLQSLIPTIKLEPAQIANGAVELMNEVATSKITGEEDRYSHTDLWDFEANDAGAIAAFKAVRPIVAAKNPTLADTIDRQFASTEAELARYKTAAGGFELYTALTTTQTRALAAQVEALADSLAKAPPIIVAG